jgi:hypothetical protein
MTATLFCPLCGEKDIQLYPVFQGNILTGEAFTFICCKKHGLIKVEWRVDSPK